MNIDPETLDENDDLQRNRTIKLIAKSVYGRTTYYPACYWSGVFARLTGTKTLTRDAIKLITLLGYHITIQSEYQNHEI